MRLEDDALERGLAALRRAVMEALTRLGPPTPTPAFASALVPAPAGGVRPRRNAVHWLLSEAALSPDADSPGAHSYGDADQAASSEEDEATRTRLIALVELARSGDRDAFGELFDHYHSSVYRFLYYRTRSQTLAEDLTSETFFRALRSMNNFRWQGRDFGAWLMTIARNLCTDHFKASRTKLERPTEDMTAHDDVAEGPEHAVLAGLTNHVLLAALKALPNEQKECLIMRFLQGLSIAETASIMGRSDGAIKQLQLRGIRNLAKQIPEDLR